MPGNHEELRLMLEERLIDAVKVNNFAELRDCIALGIRIDTGKYTSALNEAANLGRTRMLEYMLDHRKDVDIDTKNVYGMTPLLVAAQEQHVETLIALIARGANLHAHGQYEYITPTYVAGNATCAGYVLRAAIEEQAGCDDSLRRFRAMNDILIEEVYDFAAEERLSFFRRIADNTLINAQRESFSAIDAQAQLREVFNMYKEKGGKLEPESVFEGVSFNKPKTLLLRTPGKPV